MKCHDCKKRIKAPKGFTIGAPRCIPCGEKYVKQLQGESLQEIQWRNEAHAELRKAFIS